MRTGGKSRNRAISASNSPNDKDLKELAKQIRTVHLGLLLLCLALFALAWRDHPNEDKALMDAKSLASFSDYKIAEAIRTAIDAEAESSRAIYAQSRSQCLPDLRITQSDNPTNTWLIRPKADQCWLYQGRPEHAMDPVAELEGATLEEFISFWNHNKQARLFVPDQRQMRIEVFTYKNKPQLEATPEPGLPQGDAKASGKEAIEIRLEATASAQSILYGNYSGSDDNLIISSWGEGIPKFALKISMPIVSFQHTAQEIVTTVMNQKWPTNESFDHSFPELWQMTKEYPNIPLRDLQERLRGLIAYRKSTGTSDDQIEVSGIRLSPNILRVFGVLLLAGCQLYLYLHVLELQKAARNLAPGTWVVGWIGLYDSPMARAFVGLSAVLLPLAVAIGATYSSWPDSKLLLRSLQIAFDCCCVALGVLMTLCLVRLWGRLDGSTGDEGEKSAASEQHRAQATGTQS